MTANRLLAIAFVAIWFFPAHKLVHLPHERALIYSSALGEVLRLTEKDEELLERLVPSHASEFRRQRDEAAAVAADPHLVEREATLWWLIEAGAVIVGAIGVASLWWRPRFWRLGVLAGIGSFVAVSGLYYIAKLLWMTRGSPEAALNVLGLSTKLPGTIVTQLIAPFVLVAIAGYALLHRGPGTSHPAVAP